MLERQDILEAGQYNSKQQNVVFDLDELEWPWSEAEPGDGLFEWITAYFQKNSGLVVDGKMGPKTYARVRVYTRVKDDTIPGRPSVLPGAEFSNCVIVGGKRIVVPEQLLEAGVTVSNYLDDGEPHFRYKKRALPLEHFVLHETCGNTANGCKKHLEEKGYGVQLILAPNGHLSCHGDLTRETMVHANQLNKTSFGMEVVNPYNPIYARDADLWSNKIPADWWTWVPSSKNGSVKKILKRKGLLKVPREYVTPTSRQMSVARLVVPWLARITGIPYDFPTRGLGPKKRKISGWDKKKRPDPGVVAHRDFASHADGRYMLEDLISRS